MIKSENDITGEWGKTLRERLGLTQSEFWGVAHVQKNMASVYESSGRVPKKVKRLMYMHYVIGIPVDGQRSDLAAAVIGAEAVKKLHVALTHVAAASNDIKTAINTMETKR